MYAKEGASSRPLMTSRGTTVQAGGRHGRSVDIHAVAKEINGYFLDNVEEKPKPGQPARRRRSSSEEGELVGGFAALQADGTTSCGNWL